MPISTGRIGRCTNAPLLHRTHHRSLDPTPWAAYSFSPLEALVQAGIGPLIVFTLPVHPSAFAIFMLWQISFNVFGHCGYEIYPRWFLKSPIGWLLNSPTHHTLHHEKFVGNFSLYFNVWDRLLGTNCPEYEERFEAVTSSAARSEPISPQRHGGTERPWIGPGFSEPRP